MNEVAIRMRLPLPAAAGVTPQQWRVLTEAIFPAAKTPEAICLALDYCRARKLDIFKRPVNIVPMWNSELRREVETIWPGINELQVTASRTGKWAGMDEPKWGPEKTRKFSGHTKAQGAIHAEVTFPESCSVTVYRMIDGVRCGFTEPVYWEEAYASQGGTEVPNKMWQKRKRGQLHKVAKAAALRAAFPEEMGNDYAAEEMQGLETEAVGVVIEGKVESPQESAPPDNRREEINKDVPLKKPWRSAEGEDADRAEAAERAAVEAKQAIEDYETLADKHGVPIELLGAQTAKIWFANVESMLATAPTREFVEVVASHPSMIRATAPSAPEAVRDKVNDLLADAMGKFPNTTWTQPPEDDDELPPIVGEKNVMAG